MAIAVKSCVVFALLLLAGATANADPRHFYGAECAIENLSAVLAPETPRGIVLEGKSGQALAHDIACEDRPVAFRAFARALHGDVGREYVWSNGSGRSRGLFRITWEFNDHGVPCRDFASDHLVQGQRYLRQGTACLETDGNWHLH